MVRAVTNSRRKLIEVGTLCLVSVFVLIVSIIAPLFMAAPANAISNFLPDANDFGAGNGVHLEVSQVDSTGTNALSAPTTYAKVYFNKASGNTVRIHDPQWCPGKPDGVGTDVRTFFQFIQVDANENPDYSREATPDDTIAPSGSRPGGCIGYNDYVLNGLTKSTVQGHTGLYVAIIRVDNVNSLSAAEIATIAGGGGNPYKTDPASGGVNAFKIEVPAVPGNAGVVGYWNQGVSAYTSGPGAVPNNNHAFAIQDRAGSSGSLSEMTLYFAPTCSSPTQTAYLRWFDDDQNTANQNAQLSSELYAYDVDTNVEDVSMRQSFTPTYPNGWTGGSTGHNAYNEVSFTARADRKYKWVWKNVDKDNGIQIWMPFDSYNYSQVCGKYRMKAGISPSTNLDAAAGIAQDGTGVIESGRQYVVKPTITNEGTEANTEDVFLEVRNENPSFVRHVPPVSPGGPPPEPAPGNTNYLVPPGSCFPASTTPVTPVCGFPHWVYYYEANRIGPSQSSTTPSFTFELDPATTPDGALVCFEAYATPREPGPKYPGAPNYSVSSRICYTAINPSYPYVDTTKGDVHAGGAPDSYCRIATPAGFIMGQAKATNVGADYVISSLSSTTDFKSRSNANFGNVPAGPGYYGKICRPNLAKIADAYPSTKVVNLSGGSVSTATLNTTFAGADGLIYTHHGDATLTTGVINKRVTLYVKGNLIIDGNVTHGTGNYQLKDQPSFGVIATGHITVKGSVTRLDGFYSAGNDDFGVGNFDTCLERTTAACSPKLTLNGLIMGTRVYFRRTTVGSPGQPHESERVNFSGLLYINTPPAFEQSVSMDKNKPIFIGDRPPVR